MSLDPASGLVTAAASLYRFLTKETRPARYRIKGSDMPFGTAQELYAELARRREAEAATAAPPEEAAGPAAGPEEPAPPEPIPTPPPPPSPVPPTPEEPGALPPTRTESLGVPPLPVPRGAASTRPRGRPRRSSAIPELPMPSHILSARRPVDFPKPRGVHMPRGTPTKPSGPDIIMRRVDRAIERAIKRHVDKRKKGPGLPSGGWSWEVYRREAERVMRDSARRRGAQVPEVKPSRRGAFPHPPPPTPMPDPVVEEIERELERELERNAIPLPRTAESRGFGDIKHSFPRPAPAPLPPMEPEIVLPHPEVAPPPPIASPGPVQSGSSLPNPLGVAIPGLLAAAGVFAIAAARSQTRTRTRTRARSQTVTPAATATETLTPPQTVAPTATPTPAPSAPPSSPPPPTLTSSRTQGADSRCPTPAEQRREQKRKRDEKRKACKQFLSIRVPAHKRKMCVSDLTKYLFRKLQRSARAAVRKKIIAELEERGVPASRLIKATKKPRRKKAEVEVGGVEIDFEDLLGEK